MCSCHRRLHCQYRLIMRTFRCMSDAICGAALASASTPLGRGAPMAPVAGGAGPLVTLTTPSPPASPKTGRTRDIVPCYQDILAKNGLFCPKTLTCLVFWKKHRPVYRASNGKNLFFKETAKRIGSMRPLSVLILALPYTGKRFLIVGFRRLGRPESAP